MNIMDIQKSRLRRRADGLELEAGNAPACRSIHARQLAETEGAGFGQALSFYAQHLKKRAFNLQRSAFGVEL